MGGGGLLLQLGDQGGDGRGGGVCCLGRGGWW